MKTIEIKNVLKADLLVAELAEGCEYSLYDDMLYLWNDNTDNHKRFKGSYTLLGKPDEISEEDAEMLVKKVMYSQHFQNYKARKEKNFANLWCKTAKESLMSALETQVYWENPKLKISDFDYFLPSVNEKVKLQKKFDEAEQKTFDRNRTLIFKKN